MEMRLGSGDRLDPSYTHWGEAAFYFSLDLSGDLFGLQFEAGLSHTSIRDACRRAILHNRDHHAASRRPLYLRPLIERAASHVAGIDRLTSFVERSLVTASRQQNRRFPFFAVLIDDDLNERMTARLPAAMRQHTLREHFHKAVDEAFYVDLFNATIAIECAIRTENLSEWDHAVVERNKAFYSARNPLQNLVHSIDLDRRRACFRSVLAQVDPQVMADMQRMC